MTPPSALKVFSGKSPGLAAALNYSLAGLVVCGNGLSFFFFGIFALRHSTFEWKRR